MHTVTFAIVFIAACAHSAGAMAQNACANPVYLTLDTGHMESAPYIVDVLRRHRVRATFFASNLPTHNGGSSLSNEWGTWWKAVATQGHEFASLTYDHVHWRGDLRGVKPAFRMRPQAGAFAGREFTWDAAKYCEQIERAAQRLGDFTGKKSLPLFRAPGGKISPRLQAQARSCGYAHVGWSPAGQVGDELPSEKFSNATLLKRSLGEIRSGDILMAHLGASGRADPWAHANLEPLILGLKERGFCFETLRSHPAYKDWIASHPG